MGIKIGVILRAMLYKSVIAKIVNQIVIDSMKLPYSFHQIVHFHIHLFVPLLLTFNH